MPSIKTAHTAVRKLTKSAPFIRRQLNTASKAEQAGTQGATATRERLTAEFARDVRAAEAAVRDAHATADDFDRAHLILTTKTELSGGDTLAGLACAAVRLGLTTPMSSQLTAAAAQRAKEAAQQAQDRLDNAEPELRSVATLCQLNALLPGVGFDAKHPSIRSVRRAYLDASAVAADRRKAKA